MSEEFQMNYPLPDYFCVFRWVMRWRRGTDGQIYYPLPDYFCVFRWVMRWRRGTDGQIYLIDTELDLIDYENGNFAWLIAWHLTHNESEG